MQRTGFSILCFLIFGVSIASTPLQAQIDADTAVALSGELNKLGMYELSMYLLDREMKNNPKGRDKFKVQKAETFFALNKEEDGMKLLNAISSASPAYTNSRIVLGKHLWKLGKNKEAAETLEKYFLKVKSNPPKPSDKFGVNQFNDAVVYLQDCYKKLGETEKAVAVMKRLKWIEPKQSGGDAKVAKFKDIVFSALIKLDIAEQMKLDKKTGWEKDVKSVLAPLDTVLNDDGDPTLTTILAANEKLRACVLLGDFKEAKKIIDDYKDMSRSVDTYYQQKNMLYNAPSAKTYLWIAEYYHAMAEQETDKAKRMELNKKALQEFYRVLSTYDIKLCPYIPNAARGFNTVKAALLRDGVKKISTNIEIPADFDLERIQALYTKGEYDQVIPAILKILRTPGGKNKDNTPDLLSKLIDSYMHTNKMLEAITVAGYLGESFPDSPNAPLFLLKIGEIKWKEAEKKKGTPEGDQAKKDALIVYGWYTKDCPTHRYAADICAKIAMESFNDAQAKAVAVNKMPNGPEKLAANLEARKEFLKVIPKFQYIVDNYSHTKRGKEAAFIIGNCYSNAFEYLKGSDTFAKYCELETNNPKKNERLMSRVADAKFRMADNYVKYAESINKDKIDPLLKELENAPETATTEGEKTKADIQKEIDTYKAEANKYFNLAISNFKELTEKWMQKGGRLYGLTKAEDKKKVKELYDKTIAYIPWVYDYTGDIDKTIAAFSEFLKKFPDHKAVPSALKRRAFKYIEKNDTEKAAKDFAELTRRFPDKATEIQPELAKAMYQTKKYDKSIEAVKKMFEGDVSKISVANLRWVAANLADCNGKHPKEGAELALKAAKLMLERLKKPVLSDWVRKDKIAELEADAAKRETTLKIIKDQVLLMGTTAAYWAENYKTALAYLNQILSAKNTPYFYMAHFKRAEVYNKLKQYSKALKDYGEISNALLSDKKAKDSLRYKTQVLVGITYVKQGSLGKAVAAVSGAVMSVMIQDADLAALNKKEVTKEEKALQDEYIEDALFITAVCQNKLGEKEKAQQVVERYRRLYPGGRYKSQMSMLPDPEKAIELIKINIEE